MSILSKEMNSRQLQAPCNKQLYGAFCRVASCAAAFNDAAKVMECSFPAARSGPLTGFAEKYHSATLRIFFGKTLHPGTLHLLFAFH